MNITIYCHTKKVIILSKGQSSQNQLFKDIDELSPKDIFEEFGRFMDQDTRQELILGSETPEQGLERFSKAFKYIYAAGGLIRKEGHYLFIYRLDTWDLPKGKLEKGETPADGAIRECEEECGISGLSISRELSPTYHMYEHKKWGYALKKTSWYLMDTAYTGGLVPQTEEQIEKVEWFTAEQIKDTVNKNTYFAIQDVIRDGIE